MVYVMSFMALFLFADKLVAQHEISHDPKLRLHQLEYENSLGEIAITTFYYNDKGLMHEALWETKDGSRKSDNFYRYNDKGQMISAYREFSDNLTSYEIFLYDKEGHKTHETFLRSDGITGTADYIYDKKGRCDHVACNRYKGWISGDIVYKKNKKGPVQEAEIIRNDVVIGNITFEYDKNDNLIKDIWVFEGGFTQTFIYKYVKREM
ncbi:MAG: hypothetical protein U9O95_07670 [Candidatus Marinimicrobia bacterium]|nr:hypothetical protein [Candidatus Neomarinimicrobiota bacterium]